MAIVLTEETAVFWQGYKASPFFTSAKETPSIPAEGVDRGNTFSSSFGYNIESGPIFTMCSALRALTVTHDNICCYIHSRSPGDKTRPCPMRQRQQAGCHIASCDTQPGLMAQVTHPVLAAQAQLGAEEGQEGPSSWVSAAHPPPPASHGHSSTQLLLEPSWCAHHAPPLQEQPKLPATTLSPLCKEGQSSEQSGSPEVCEQHGQAGKHSSAVSGCGLHPN